MYYILHTFLCVTYAAYYVMYKMLYTKSCIYIYIYMLRPPPKPYIFVFRSIRIAFLAIFGASLQHDALLEHAYLSLFSCIRIAVLSIWDMIHYWGMRNIFKKFGRHVILNYALACTRAPLFNNMCSRLYEITIFWWSRWTTFPKLHVCT